MNETKTKQNPILSNNLRTVVIAVAIAQFLLPFMVTGVAPLLPVIGKEFNASALELSLVVVSYTLSLSIMHLIAGRIGDMFGRKRIFLTGLGIFSFGVAAIPFSPSIEIFLLLRFVQATGTGMMNTCALAILVAVAPPAMRGRVLGIAATGMFIGLSIGPSVAGFVSTLFTWHIMFLILIPVCIFAWLVMFYSVKEEWYDSPNDPFDWVGTLFFTLGISAFTIGSIWLLQETWAIALTLVGVLLICAFIFIERRVCHPLLDVDFLIHNKSFAIGALSAFLNYAATFGMIFYISLYLQMVHEFSVMKAGLFLSIQPITQILIAATAGRFGDRFGAARVSTIGMIICTVNLWVLANFDADTSIFTIAIVQIAIGIGISAFTIPNTSDIMGSVDSAHLGQASGLVGTVRTMGMLVCMMIISLSMNSYLGAEQLSPSNAHKFLSAMQMNFHVFAILNMIGVGVSCLRLDFRKKRN